LAVTSTTKESVMAKAAVTPFRLKFGKRLRTMRERRKLSQTELGKKTGMSGKYISKVEQGGASLNLDALHATAKALKVNLHWLVTV